MNSDKDKKLNDTYNFVMKYHGSDPTGHDSEHISRVYNNAVNILKSHKNADGFVVKMAALLHDVDDYKINPAGGKVVEWLNNAGVSKDDVSKITYITENIGYSKSGDNPDFPNIETKIVYDADKLDAIGATAVARVFAYGGARGRPIFVSSIIPIKEFDAEYYKASITPGINHFFEKLLKLKDLLQTEEAKKEGLKRHKFMVKYLGQFFKEQKNPAWIKYFKEYVSDIDKKSFK